jgi:hypothetical protein
MERGYSGYASQDTINIAAKGTDITDMRRAIYGLFFIFFTIIFL